jgi:hypothetical protein
VCPTTNIITLLSVSMARASGTPWLVMTASPASRMRTAPGEFTGRVATAPSTPGWASSTSRNRVATVRTIIEDADPEEIPMWMARIAPVEERRHERIKHLVGEPTLNAVYQVVAEDDLSRPIPA